MTFTKEEIVKALKDNVCEVTFTKTDGTERVMVCSLKEAILEPYIKAAEERKKQMLAEGKEVKVKPENPNTLSVIDMGKKAWRSFRIDSVKSVRCVDEE